MLSTIKPLVLALLFTPLVASAQLRNSAEQLSAVPESMLPLLASLEDLQDLSELESLSSLHELSSLSELSQLSDLQELSAIATNLNSGTQSSCEVSNYAAEKQRVIEKTYKVNKSDILQIENKFGKVHINTWDRNEIRVAVTVISRASTEQKAQEMLDKIRVTDSRSGKTISWITDLEPIKVQGNYQRSFEINYVVSMPAENQLTVKNSFGDVYLASFKGKADLTVRYGSLKTGQLSNSDNVVKVAYSSANCGFINGGAVDIAYSSINVEGTNGLQGESKFSSFKIGSLHSDLDLSVKHGSLRVDNISKNVSKINVDSGFSPIALNFEDNSSFNFDVNVQFGSFNFDKNVVNVSSLQKSHTSAAYKGKYGSASSKGSVSIVSKYGDVKFSK